MRIGYARISANDPDSRLQLDFLEAAGCSQVFRDECVSGSPSKRPALARALSALKAGDTLVVWKLDRLGGSLSELVRMVRDLDARDIGFQSLAESIDTTSSQGSLMSQLIGALADFERSLITERTAAGLVAARQRGVKAGRKPKLTPDKISQARVLIDQGESPGEVARSLNVSVATLYRHIPAVASNRVTFDLFAGSES